jgi:hypothetical protein
MINPLAETAAQKLRASFREAATAFFKVMDLRGYTANNDLNEIERKLFQFIGPNFFSHMRGANPNASRIIMVMLGASHIAHQVQPSDIYPASSDKSIKLEEVAIRACGDQYWASCKQFPKSSWIYAIENEETILGYWSWVVHQAEHNGIDLQSLCADEQKAERSREP